MGILRSTVLAAGAALVLAGTSAAALAQAKYNWTFQTSETAGEPQYEIKKEWARNVEAMSGGQIKIEILPIGAVVPHAQTLEAVGTNILQGHTTAPNYFAGLNPAFAMMGDLVGAWGNPLEFLEYMKQGGGEQIYRDLVAPYGVHHICAAATGLESFPSKKPIRSVADLKGIKMRAPEGMVASIFSKAGATPVNLPGSEVYTALEKGVVDAADCTVFSTNQTQGLHKFARYPNYPGFHSLPMVDVAINKQIWDGLPQNLKTVLKVSCDAMAYQMVFALKELDIKAVAEARKDPNIEIIDLSPEERKKFRAVAQQEWETWAKRNAQTQKFYDSVVPFLKSRNLL